MFTYLTQWTMAFIFLAFSGASAATTHSLENKTTIDPLPQAIASSASTPILWHESSDDAARPENESSDEESVIEACGSMNELACDMFFLVNAIRVDEGVDPLAVLEKCVEAAQAHAVDMAERDYFSHDSPDESFQERMERFELSGATYGENIALSKGEAERALDLWLNSPGHLANILNPDFKSTGIGYENGLWVQCFSGHTPSEQELEQEQD